MKDTYCMISMALKDFANSFQLEDVKEVMPYKLYNSQTLKQVYVPIIDGINVLFNKSLNTDPQNKDEVTKQFLDNIDKWKCRGYTDTINIIEYATRSCEIDVSVFKARI